MDYSENYSDVVIALIVLGSMMTLALIVGLAVFMAKRRSTPTAQPKQDDEQENAEEVNLDVVDPPFPQIIQ